MDAGRLDEPLSERVRRDLRNYTAAERRVAQSLLQRLPGRGVGDGRALCAEGGHERPTILRFVSRLGLKSYAEFQNRLRGEVQERLQGPLARYPSLRSWARAARSRNGSARCCAATSSVRSGACLPRNMPPSRNWSATGGARCSASEAASPQMLAAYFHHCLRELRPGVRLVREGSASWADYLLDVRRGDVLVVFDFRRYQRDVLEFASGAATQGAVIVLITDIWNSPIAALATHVIGCPVEVPTAFDSAVGGLAMAEVIVAGAVERLGEHAKRRIETLEVLRRPFHLESAPPSVGRKPDKNGKRGGLAS